MNQSSASAGLLEALRRETAGEHQALEDGLDLLRPPFDQDRFAVLLERFYGFHAVFEPEALKCGRWGEFVGRRRKLPSLFRDLKALGRTEEKIASLAWCVSASDLTRSPPALLGALYVVEGSVLGGQVISRALKDVDWAPPGGFGYFQPYGAGAGEMWRAFRAEASAASDPMLDASAIEAAKQTFALLIQWLAPAFRKAA